jgi:hypothetical protein
MGKTQYKPLAERHVRGTAWKWHGMCELAFMQPIFLENDLEEGTHINTLPISFPSPL